jgi:hypothetical protein
MSVPCTFPTLRGEYSISVGWSTSAPIVRMSRSTEIGGRAREFWKRGSFGLDAACITGFDRGEASGRGVERSFAGWFGSADGEVDDDGILGCRSSGNSIDVIHCAECGAPYSSESFANLEFN